MWRFPTERAGGRAPYGAEEKRHIWIICRARTLYETAVGFDDEVVLVRMATCSHCETKRYCGQMAGDSAEHYLVITTCTLAQNA